LGVDRTRVFWEIIGRGFEIEMGEEEWEENKWERVGDIG
jgi:hypothetical protein